MFRSFKTIIRDFLIPDDGLKGSKHIGLFIKKNFNPLNAELNPICHLLALLGGANIVVVSRLRVK